MLLEIGSFPQVGVKIPQKIELTTTFDNLYNLQRKTSGETT